MKPTSPREANEKFVYLLNKNHPDNIILGAVTIVGGKINFIKRPTLKKWDTIKALSKFMYLLIF